MNIQDKLIKMANEFESLAEKIDKDITIQESMERLKGLNIFNSINDIEKQRTKFASMSSDYFT
jgi:hypothetical protein